MSYDLAVFEPSVVPKERAKFLEWYALQTEWKESHGYNNPENSSLALRSWFFEMIEYFPAMNSKYAFDEPDNPKVTDYSIGRTIIYAAFAWLEADEAWKTTFRLAEKYQVGFIDVSSRRSDIYLPNSSGLLTVLSSESQWSINHFLKFFQLR